MQLPKVLFFVWLIYGTFARDFLPELDPYVRRLIEASRSIINSECKNILESQRDNFKNGWPVVGIEPLDPIEIQSLELSLGTTNLTLVDAQLRGISDFKINYCDLKVLGLYASISLHFDTLRVDGKHITNTKLGQAIYRGQGDLELSFIDVDVIIEVELDVIKENRLNLDTFNLEIDVRKVEAHLKGFGAALTDTLISAVVGEAVKLAINTGELLFEPLFSAIIYPLNVALNEITLPNFLARIIDFIRQYN